MLLISIILQCCIHLSEECSKLSSVFQSNTTHRIRFFQDFNIPLYLVNEAWQVFFHCSFIPMISFLDYILCYCNNSNISHPTLSWRGENEKKIKFSSMNDTFMCTFGFHVVRQRSCYNKRNHVCITLLLFQRFPVFIRLKIESSHSLK